MFVALYAGNWAAKESTEEDVNLCIQALSEMRWGYSFNEARIANIRWAWEERMQQQGHSPHSVHSAYSGHGISPPPPGMGSYNGYLSSAAGRMVGSFEMGAAADGYDDDGTVANGTANGNGSGTRSGSSPHPSRSSPSSHGSPSEQRASANPLNLPHATHAHLSHLLHPEPSSSSTHHHYTHTHPHTLPQSLPPLSHAGPSSLPSGDASLFFDITRAYPPNPPAPILSPHTQLHHSTVSAIPFYNAATRAAASFYHPSNDLAVSTNGPATGDSSLGEISSSSEQRAPNGSVAAGDPSAAGYWNFQQYD
jgi:hypothetical protein